MSIGIIIAAAALANQRPVGSDLEQSGALRQSLRECRAMRRDKARLDCFDEAVRLLDDAAPAPPPAGADQHAAAARPAFGLRKPPPSRTVREDSVASLTAKAMSFSRNAAGQLTVVLDTGGVWQQTDDEVIAVPLRPGAVIQIRRAALGSYKMSVAGYPPVHARRIR